MFQMIDRSQKWLSGMVPGSVSKVNILHLHVICIFVAEFLKFVRSEEECRRKWHDAEVQCDKLRRRIKEIDQEKLALDTQLRHAR